MGDRMIDETGARRLCAAVVREAVRDYKQSLEATALNPHSIRAESTKRECEEFFLGEDLCLYSDYDGEYYIIQAYRSVYRDALVKLMGRPSDAKAKRVKAYCEDFFEEMEHGEYIIRKVREEAEKEFRESQKGKRQRKRGSRNETEQGGTGAARGDVLRAAGGEEERD